MTNNIRWGLDKPHPFSHMKTELLWKGKYDEYGNRRGMVMKFFDTGGKIGPRIRQWIYRKKSIEDDSIC